MFTIHTLKNTVANENTYIIENDHHLILIDPGSDIGKISSQILALEKPLTAILLTHAHYDHIMGADYIRQHFHYPPLYQAQSEANWLNDPISNRSGLPHHDDMKNVIIQPADAFYRFDHLYHLDDFHFYVLESPGHSIGGVVIIFPKEKNVFTGDTLFYERIGRSDFFTGNHSLLLKSIHTQLFSLDDNFNVYPGHGKTTTIKHEKQFNLPAKQKE